MEQDHSDSGAGQFLRARSGHGCSSALGHSKLSAAGVHVVGNDGRRVVDGHFASSDDEGFDQGEPPPPPGGSCSVLALAGATPSPQQHQQVFHLVAHPSKRPPRTSSPSGRSHPDKQRRDDLRLADFPSDVCFFASSRARLARPDVAANGPFALGKAAGPLGDPDGFSSRLPPTQSWISTQSWLESLRYYGGADPPEEEHLTGSFKGTTHGRRVHGPHLEAGVRHRVGLAAPDPEWNPDQLPKTWAPDAISPSMQKRLDRTLHRLMAARSQSAPHNRPGTGGGRGTAGVGPGRLALLAAPRGDPLQRQARHTQAAADDGRAGKGAKAASSKASSAERLSAEVSFRRRRQYDQQRRSTVGPVPEKRPPTRFVHGVVKEGSDAKAPSFGNKGGGGKQAAAASSSSKPAPTTVLATSIPSA